MESILNSIKKLLGGSAADDHFDTDIITHINSVFTDLNLLGVGPSSGFTIEDDTSEWTDFISNPTTLQSVKSYMYLRVKLLFDSSTLSSAVIASMEKQIEKFESLLNIAAENDQSGIIDENVSEEIQALIAQLESENEELKTLNATLEADNASLRENIETLEEANTALESDNVDLRLANESLTERNSELVTNNETLQSENTTLENQLEELSSSIKPEQEKSVTIAENGAVDILPDDGKTLSKVAVTVEVPSSGDGEDDFVGIKYSNYTGDYYNIPKTADARSLDKQKTPCDRILQNAFSNGTINANGGYFAFLEEVYLPENVVTLYNTFANCSKLTTIHGGLSKITSIESAFKSCTSLDINAVIARMSKLKTIGNSSFEVCTQITELTLYATITSIHTNAFNGCTNIERITIPEGWNISLYFQYSNNLTQESLHAMIEHLADMSDSTTTKYFRVESTNIAKIDEEHIAMLNTKNWNYS